MGIVFGEYCRGDVGRGYYARGCPVGYVLMPIFELNGISQKENRDCVDR